LLVLVTWCVLGEDPKKTSKSIDPKQIKGLKKLLKGLDAGVFTTCSIAFFSEKVTYDEADQRCKNFDIGSGRGEEGNLVTVNDDVKNTDLKLLLEMAYPEKQQPKSKWTDTKWVWAGLRKTKNNKNKDSKDYNPVDWEWADGSHPKDFSKWAKNQPDQNTERYRKKGCDEKPTCFQNQMRINHNGQWDDTYKFKTHPYACDYKGKYILSNEPKMWIHAREACESAGLHLAKVRGPQEVEEIKTAITYFLGEPDPAWKVWDANNWIWLGGNDLDTEGIWTYHDGELVETWDIPWRPGAGKDNAEYLQGNGQHALAMSRWGEFDDSFHNQKSRKRPFACQCPGS